MQRNRYGKRAEIEPHPVSQFSVNRSVFVIHGKNLISAEVAHVGFFTCSESENKRDFALDVGIYFPSNRVVCFLYVQEVVRIGSRRRGRMLAFAIVFRLFRLIKS